MYEVFEHTADLGLRIEAPSLEQLFAEAAEALLSIIVDNPAEVRDTESRTIALAGSDVNNSDRELLLFDWLSELLHLFEVNQLLVARAEVHVQPSGLSAQVWGEPLDTTRHHPAHEVKAITYHGLKLEQSNNGWLAEVIVDI